MRLVSVAACAAALASSTLALASPDLLLDGQEQTLGGTHRFRTVHLTNNARIKVAPHDGTDQTGVLQIIAHRILIDASSSIDATGAGHQGVTNGIGTGPGNGKGADKPPPFPGGGAGYGGKGGPGVANGSCSVPDNTTRGGFYDAFDVISMGSSGSAASAGDAGAASRGGNGGGAIDLRAGKIEISGQLIANGNNGFPSDEAAGAGSGGGIRILAWVFTTYDTTTVFTVAGGVGGKSKDFEGGAGAGGRIFLFVPQAPAQVFTALVDGGKGTCATAWGADGVVQPGVAPLDCADLDSDGVFSNECVAPKGDDCDDSDPAVHPGAVELCNNADDDCDGLVDNGADADCAGGTCENGKCTPPDAGPDAELPDAAEEDAVEPSDAPVEEDAGGFDAAPDAGAAEPSNDFTLRGGCAQSRGGEAGAWISLIMIGLALVQRRRR